MPSIRKAFVLVLGNIVFGILLFSVIEGLSSTVIVARKAKYARTIAERRHTQYDEEIGWINSPNLSLEDMYGGKSFITNSLSFRNKKEFSFSVPGNKVRVMCSGDSYTMGYGVGNDDVWCKRLESIDSRIEAVNLGQGGYGIDQAYLWYKRNSVKLEHNVQIFAFITDDFRRMLSNNFLGYGKSFLVLQDDTLVNTNEPVPKFSYLIPRLHKILQELRQLNSVQLLRQKFAKNDSASGSDNPSENSPQARELVVKIVRNLQEINKAQNSTLVLVYLPTKADFMGRRSEEWRQFFHSEAISQEFIFIDLIDEFRKYPPQEVHSLFNGHYSEKGNTYIANILYKKLLSIPEIASRFQED